MWSSKKWANGPWPTSWSSPAIRRVSTTRPSDGSDARRRRPLATRPSAGSGRASGPRAPASCITPRPCVKRECSAVGKTQRALWSWLIRRSRWSQAVSSRSSSATSSVRQPGRRRLVGREPLGQLDVAVDRVADQVDGGERRPASGSAPSPAPPRSARAARRSVSATSSRSEAGPTTSTSSPHDRIQRRISIVPATVACQTSEPSASSVGPLGRVPGRLEDARRDAGRKRRTTSVAGWSAMMSQARRRLVSSDPGSGGVERLRRSARRPGCAPP